MNQSLKSNSDEDDIQSSSIETNSVKTIVVSKRGYNFKELCDRKLDSKCEVQV